MIRLPVAALVMLLPLACASCGGKAPSVAPITTSSPSIPTTKTSSPPPSPTVTVPPYLAAYSSEQRSAFRHAVAALEKFTTQNGRLLARGEATPAALAFYRKYSIDWVTAWANLGQLANNHVRVAGTARATTVRPISVKVDPAHTTTVVLRRCLDESKLRVTENGAVLGQPNLRKPHVYRVRLETRHSEGWWRVGTAEQGRPC